MARLQQGLEVECHAFLRTFFSSSRTFLIIELKQCRHHGSVFMSLHPILIHQISHAVHESMHFRYMASMKKYMRLVVLQHYPRVFVLKLIVNGSFSHKVFSSLHQVVNEDC